jgi:penicillin-binding protein 2
MRGVVREGSAIRSNVREIEICGKTGTAQNPHGEDHGWFIGFAPADNPKVAVAVFVENKGFASRYAAPIGTLLIQYYLDRKIYRKDLYDSMLNTPASEPPASATNSSTVQTTP